MLLARAQFSIIEEPSRIFISPYFSGPSYFTRFHLICVTGVCGYSGALEEALLRIYDYTRNPFLQTFTCQLIHVVDLAC